MGAISWFLNFLIITALIFSHVSVVASFSAIPSNTIDHKFKRLPVKRKLRQPPSTPPPPRASDNFAWVSISGLPSAVWNKDCISCLNRSGKDYWVDVTVSEINRSVCPCLSSTKHSKGTTLSSGSEDEDTQTVNDDNAISSDEPHPRKADVDDFEIIIHLCLGRFSIFDPNAATNMTVHPLSFFPEIVEFVIQQNAILASEET
ncbi:hypothetical protein OIU79_030629 [Salix purpurea]|uniref:Uncharacterized protein n=1 Tax=Salix purpurea TaxID=77065 RepID=A0A9Q0ZRN7_SALPP|nr:hypothetical protein OIU79_030629 [Salix purpurea]